MNNTKTAAVTPESEYYLGVDVGATGTKAAVVNVHTGALVSPRLRVDTAPVAEEIFTGLVGLIHQLRAQYPQAAPRVGVAFPAVIRHGEICTSANIDHATVGMNLPQLLAEHGIPEVFALNDADAAGIAEAQFGALADQPQENTGTALVLTLGTGIGSALFSSGRLVPNTELGHVKFGQGTAESYAAGSAIARDGLDWPSYAQRLSEVLAHLHRVFFPEVFVLGGGVSRDAESFVPLLACPCPVRVAQLRADAGIIGAAWAAWQAETQH